MKNTFLAALLLCSSINIVLAQQANSVCISDTLFVQTYESLGPDGTPDYTYTFKNLPDGYTILYLDAAHSKKIMEGELLNNRFEGEWLFYQNGILYQKIHYQNDMMNGTSITLFNDGQIAQLATFVNDLMEGDLYLYHPNGIVSTHCIVVHGIASNCTQFDINGNSIQQ